MKHYNDKRAVTAETIEMKARLQVVRGSHNVFADFGVPDATCEHLKAVLSARIIEVHNALGVSLRQASQKTGISAARLSQVRNFKLDHFRIEDLVKMLEQLNQRVEFTVEVTPARNDQLG